MTFLTLQTFISSPIFGRSFRSVRLFFSSAVSPFFFIRCTNEHRSAEFRTHISCGKYRMRNVERRMTHRMRYFRSLALTLPAVSRTV